MKALGMVGLSLRSSVVYLQNVQEVTEHTVVHLLP